jgi:hypothetical protein
VNAAQRLGRRCAAAGAVLRHGIVGNGVRVRRLREFVPTSQVLLDDDARHEINRGNALALFPKFASAPV